MAQHDYWRLLEMTLFVCKLHICLNMYIHTHVHVHRDKLRKAQDLNNLDCEFKASMITCISFRKTHLYM